MTNGKKQTKNEWMNQAIFPLNSFQVGGENTVSYLQYLLSKQRDCGMEMPCQFLQLPDTGILGMTVLRVPVEGIIITALSFI